MVKGFLFSCLFVGAFSFGRAQEAECWLTSPSAGVYLRREAGLDFSRRLGAGAASSAGSAAGSSAGSELPVIAIDESQTFQTVDGFGFALTGGSAQHLMRMSASRRAAVLHELFGREGVRVNYLRVSIGASDLNDHVFSYDDLPAGETDVPLTHFDLGPDKKEVIPVLHEILAINPAIKILASPWSAPTWMKTNNTIQGGHLAIQYYPVYAQYLLKYLNAMKAEGITIDALTLQNEPFNNGNTPSMQMLAKEQARFIRDHVGPLFLSRGVKTKIVLYDHNCDAPEYPISILSDPRAFKYIDGSGFHLYAGPITALSKVHDAFPGKNCYFTEMMVTNRNGHFNVASPEERIVIGAMRNWSKNVILWNLAADAKFEPHTDNGGCASCQGAVTIEADSVERNSGYYTIAHASKFVDAGSVRIASTSLAGLANVAFRTTDGKIVVIVANSSGESRRFAIAYNGGSLSAALDGGAVATYSFKAFVPSGTGALEVKTASGMVRGAWESNGVRVFKGIPYAAPPVGGLRWKEPQPVKSWAGVRDATEFGDRPMQVHIWDDMVFRSKQASEDCLYLNVWAGSGRKLPVFVYFHGGGLFAGDGSELRYDGTSLAARGMVVVTINYRLGIFGFFAHPGLTAESPHHVSGNYGFLDQVAALKWVRDNIAAFGGDPAQVTIGGQSAGARSVSGQMASPLAAGLFERAIGESGSMMGATPIPTLAEGEKNGAAFGEKIHMGSLAALRAMPAEALLEAAGRSGLSFGTVVDGYFLPEEPLKIYGTGKQADVPLLAGWNAADDSSIAYNAGRWIDLHSKTDGYPVYRYYWSHPLPGTIAAAHSSELPFVFGSLGRLEAYSWTSNDFAISDILQGYITNFIKTGDPNGAGLPQWSGLQSSIPKVMVIDSTAHQEPEKNLKR